MSRIEIRFLMGYTKQLTVKMNIRIAHRPSNLVKFSEAGKVWIVDSQILIKSKSSWCFRIQIPLISMKQLQIHRSIGETVRFLFINDFRK